ncbi:MAG TPA: ATP-binding protein [Chitinophagaceae bacterium]|nr:ATP-binding protein [Chitinophagaceae bacterium]
MRSIKIALYILLPVFSIAQVNPLFLEPTKHQADSLRKALEQNINDTLRMAANRELALFYFDINSDSAFFYIEKDLPLARKLQLKLWEADALDLMGLISSIQGNYVKAMRSFNEALQIVENKECEKNIWNISKFTNSRMPEFARLSMLGTIQSDVAGIYSTSGNYDKQLNTIQDCIKTATRINDNTLLSQAFMNLGAKFLQENGLDSALISFRKSLGYSDRAGYKKYRSNNYNNIGRIYLRQNLYEQALENFLNALRSGKEQNNNSSIGDSYVLMSRYYNKTGKNDSALYYAKLGLVTGQNTGQVTNIIQAYNSLVDIYKNQKRPDSALLYLQLANAAQDSLLSLEKIKQLQNIGFDEQLRLQELEKESLQTKSKIRIYSLLGGLGILLIAAVFLFRNNRQKQRSNKVLEATLTNLRSTQSQLVQSEKMASLGELTAGIAHEIQNPLNFVNNFSDVNGELLTEMKDELIRGKTEAAIALANDVIENQKKINHHGKRADTIVKGMLQHSRSSNGIKEPTDINTLCDEYLRLAYHGLRAKDSSFNAITKTDFDNSIGQVNIIPQDIGRVILNLINNAFYAVDEKKRSGVNNYEPTVSISTKKTNGRVEIKVNDNGNGIPQKVLDKIFLPFFTTKPTGQGTGLGLSLSYDIVKTHGGELKVKTKEGEGSVFAISLPTTFNN